MNDWDIKVFHDGACPLCRREIAMLRSMDPHQRVALEDIADPAFDASQYGLTREQVHAYIHGVLPDGTVVRGMEVFRRVYEAVGRGWVWRWTAWPVFRPIADAAYWVWAKMRPLFGSRRAACGDETCGPR